MALADDGDILFADLAIAEHMDPEKPAPGGIEPIVRAVLTDGAWRQPILLCVRRDSSPARKRSEEIRSASFRFRYVASLSPDGVKGRLPESLVFAAGLIRNRKLLPDCTFHAHRLETAAVLLLLRKRVVLFIHNGSAGLLGSNSDSFWKYLAPIYRLLERIVLPRVAAVAVFGRGDLERLRRIRPSTVRLETSFDPAVFFPGQPHFTLSKIVTIAWVGRLESQKDPLLAIRVLREIKDLCPADDIRLVMVGSGSLADTVIAEAKALGVTEALELPGALAQGDVARLLRERSSVTLLTSHYEGSPTIIVESLASGVPVVACAEADPDGLLHGRAGRTVEGREPWALAQALLETLKDGPTDCSEVVAHRTRQAMIRRIYELPSGGIS